MMAKQLDSLFILLDYILLDYIFMAYMFSSKDHSMYLHSVIAFLYRRFNCYVSRPQEYVYV